MKRLHVHVSVSDLAKAIGFYSGLFKVRPCCAGPNYANWRVGEPAINFSASIGHGPRGAMHFGLEVDTPADLPKIDRALHGPLRSSSALPWEVSVRKPAIRKDLAS
jgi:catechol 2,3-dioxygenase-like lactoylglutathione lyase family enzyme